MTFRPVAAARMNATDTPIRVRLTGLERLAPEGLTSEDFEAWLTAPIAGEPLYKRILGVLLPLRILELVLERGPASDAVLALFRERPIYNLRARMAKHLHPVSPEDAATLVVPVGGLLEADLAGLVARGFRRGRIERTPVNLPGQEMRRHEIVFLPPGRSAEEFDPESPATDVYSPAPPILRPTDSSVALRELSQRALEGDLQPVIPVGEWRDGLLLGEGARVDPGVRVVGKAAVGAESVVEAGVVLGPGAVVGERCHVDRGAHVTHSIVLDGSRVRERERLLGLVQTPSGASL